MAFAALLAAVVSVGVQPSFEPQSLAFWDARHGLVQGAELRGKHREAVWMTADGGRTWRTVKRGPGPYWIAAVRGGSDGWIALPGALLRSGDRGRTWSTFSRGRDSWRRTTAVAPGTRFASRAARPSGRRRRSSRS